MRARDIKHDLVPSEMSEKTLFKKLKELTQEDWLEHTWVTTDNPPASVYVVIKKLDKQLEKMQTQEITEKIRVWAKTYHPDEALVVEGTECSDK